MVKRMLEANASDFAAMHGADLAESIRISEGRTLAAEILCTVEPSIDGLSGGELAAAMGADIVSLDGYDPLVPQIAGASSEVLGEQPLMGYGALLGRPVGINLIVADEAKVSSLGGRRFSEHSANSAIEQGAKLIFLYARPHQGGTPERQISAAQHIAQSVEYPPLIVGVPSFSMPPPRNDQNLTSIRNQALALLDAGCAGAAFPMPGSKQGWALEATAALIDSVHEHDGLAWLFVTGSIEGAPQSVMHDLALLGKQLGADAFRLDEAGLSGLPPPENIFAFSLALRGARHTYRRMASSIYR